ncbi:MAG TPA: hypothetical protein VM689_04435 [Aliidongia sp.]|nr:hypothetical protein [Aliidongia sp.]
MTKTIGLSLIALSVAWAPPASAASGNFISSCEADVFATAQSLGVEPNLYAPGTDGPNTVTATDRQFASGQPQARSLDLPPPPANPAPPSETADRQRALLTQALIAARRDNDFLCRARIEDARRAADAGSAEPAGK